METLARMSTDDMVPGVRCVVVYGDKPNDQEEAMIVDLLPPTAGGSWSWRALVRFADGEEYDYLLHRIRQIA